MIVAKINLDGAVVKEVIYPDSFMSQDDPIEDARLLGEDILGWVDEFGTPIHLKVELEIEIG